MTENQSVENVDVGIAELLNQARRLGLTWGLRPATMTSETEAVYDGDEEAIIVISLVGHLLQGARVMVMFVPPAGNYVIGFMTSKPPTTTKTETFTAAGTWEKSLGARSVWVRAVGGGGAGGGTSTTGAGQGACAGGGGGGGYVEKLYAANDLPSSVAIVIGAGGTPGAVGANPGGDGGDTTFATLVAGGGGGGAGTGAASNAIAGGGPGGIATDGDVNVPGESGDTGRTAGGTTVTAARGGGTVLGHGAIQASSINSANGNAGGAHGGGGSGAINRDTAGSANRAGGAGAAGAVIVVTFY